MTKLLISITIIVIIVLYNIIFNETEKSSGYYSFDLMFGFRMLVSVILGLIGLLIIAYVF